MCFDICVLFLAFNKKENRVFAVNFIKTSRNGCIATGILDLDFGWGCLTFSSHRGEISVPFK